MKKRLQCLFLTMILLLTGLCTACGKEEDIDTVSLNKGNNKAPAMTITLWGIKEAGTTDEAIALVEEAMSAVTRSKFNTNLKLNLYTEDEYIDALENRMSEIAAEKERQEAEAEAEAAKNMLAGGNDEEETEETVAPDVTSINELGLVEIVYPDPDPDQLDIFLIPDYDKYEEYANADYLSVLDAELETTGKILKTYINPNILNASKLNGVTYSIINNKPVGKYTYLLLNKDLLDKYYYDADEIAQFSMADEFIMDIGANEPGIVPVFDACDPVGVHYLTADGSKSVVGAMLSATAKKDKNAYGVPRIIFSQSGFVDHYKQIKKYQSLGYLGDGTAEPGKFAVGVISGNVADIAKYQDQYIIKVLQKPYIDNTIFNNMFAVSTYTKDLTRSMEVLTALNTDSELRNAFAYGVEGVHYKLDADGVVQKLSNDYNVSIERTGNMFITYPPEGTYADVWEDCKLQNLELTDSPFFGFMPERVVDETLYKSISEISKRYFAELDSISYAGYDAWIERAVTELTANADVTAYTSFYDDRGLAYQYNEWFFALFPDALAM